MFDPSRKPRLPESASKLLQEREKYFDPKIGEDEEGFTLQDAEALGWNVDLFHASKPFPGRGLVEVHAGRGVLDSNEGRYGVLKAIYDYELKEHQRAQARARDVWERHVQEHRLMQQALDAAWVGLDEVRALGPDSSEQGFAARKMAHAAAQEALREALRHGRQRLKFAKELDAFAPLELPEELIDYLKETKPLNATRRERAT